MSKWFMYDPDCGYDEFDTEEEALSAAERAIDYYRDCDGWPEDVAGVTVGRVTHRADKFNVVTRDMIDAEGCCNGTFHAGLHRGQFDEECDYKMIPAEESPHA